LKKKSFVLNDLVSVIITTYNSEKSIFKAISSVANQLHKNIELLIYDDCSTDGTISVIESSFADLDFECIYLKGHVNFGGPARGRNWGLDNANGDFICFLDADDFWFEDKLNLQLSCINQLDLDFVSSDAVVSGGDNFNIKAGFVSKYSQIRRNRFILSSALISRSIYKDAGLKFNESNQYSGVEDYDFFLRVLVANFRGYVMDQKLISYSFDSNSLSHSNVLQNEERRLLVLRNMKFSNFLDSLWRNLIYIIYKTYLDVRFNSSELQ
jgi:teichuronic acid biosynthesis glycosyltransferase TuaG